MEKWTGQNIAIQSESLILDKMEVEMNIFCDASKQAYRALVDFVLSVNNIRKNCSFVLSRSQFSALKDQDLITIPTLELQDAVLAGRLKNKIINELDIKIDSIRFGQIHRLRYVTS